ncbi:MAG: glycosyltransferase family 2 protein [Ruminococcus sp.]|nr:glycosyltransferase family 2 protein [Ruminococcus sp.]
MKTDERGKRTMTDQTAASRCLISVIIPVYNAGPYIARCLDSVLAQTFPCFEVILVDDGSTDNSGEICDEYALKDNRIKVIHQPNGGQSAARNVAIDAAVQNDECKWIAFVDSDDKIHPRYLELLYHAAVDNDCSVSGCNYMKVYQDTDFPQIKKEPQMITAEAFYCDRTVSAISPWSKLIRKELFNGVRYPDLRYHEDEFVSYRLIFPTEKIAYIDEPLYMNFATPDSITRSPWHPDRMVKLDAIKQQAAYLKANGQRRAYRRAITYYESSVKTFIASAEKWKAHEDAKRLKKMFYRHMLRHLPCFVLYYLHPSSIKRKELT